MSELTISPGPGGFGGELAGAGADDDAAGVAAVRFGRSQVIALVGGLFGVLLLAVVAPNLSDDTRALAFEPPPDPLQVSFHPPTVVTAIGVLWILAAAVTFLPDRLARVAATVQALAVASVIPFILVVALALSEAPSTNVTILLQQSLVLATPLALGAMTGLWCERSGIVNIGIEGMMLASAGVGYMSYALLGDAAGGVWLWIAILIAVVAGGLFGALHAWLSIRFQINQIVAGVVINLVALGLTGFLRSQVIVPSGFSKGHGTPVVALPLLSHIPIVGEALFTAGPIHFAMFAIVFVTWLVMYRTPWGLRVRSCGEHPHAAETVGIHVPRMRYQAVIVGGVIAGVAGAWFSMEGPGGQAGFEDNMTNSAGFIALAALIVGKWTPWGAFGGALLFGFARALGSRLQFLNVAIGGFGIPSEFFQALPYVVTLVVVAGALGRSIAPAAEGQPYTPSK